MWDGAAYIQLAQFWVTNEVDGIKMHATSNDAIPGLHTFLGYVGIADPTGTNWIGFNGVPRGILTSYWF
jgi:hypothetical protein